MDAKRRRATLALILLSLGLAIWGQYVFARQQMRMWDGVLLYGLAMLSFGGALTLGAPKSERPAPRRLWLEVTTLWRDLSHRRYVVIAACALSLGVGYIALGRPQAKSFTDLLLLWIVAILLAVGAFVDWQKLRSRLRGPRPRLGPEVVAVALLVLATFLLRAIRLETIPGVLSGDEASMGLETVAVLKGHSRSPFVTGWLSHPTLYFFIQSVFLRWFGITVAGLRFSSALVSAGIALLLYIMGRRFYGRGPALLMGLFFATYHYAIHFGRLAINNIWDPMFALGVFFWVQRGLEKGRSSDFAAAGFCLGAAMYFYMGSRLIPIMLLLYVVYLALFHRELFRTYRAKLLITSAVALVVAAPLLVYFQRYPHQLLSRYQAIGIFPMGWVDEEVARTGKTKLLVFLLQWVKAALGFNYKPDPTFWYRPGIPLLQFVPSIFLVYGFVFAVRRWRQPAYFLPALWFFLVILFGGALMENPPTSPRLVLSMPAVAILVIVGLKEVVVLLARAARWPQSLTNGLMIAIALAICFGSYHFYFDRYTPDNEFGGTNTVVADTMGKYLDSLGPTYRCYFFGAPRMYYSFATIPYLAQDVTGQDVTEPLVAPPTFVSPAYEPVFCFLPERLGELEMVKVTYPNGLLREFKDDDGMMLFISYEAQGAP